jgi:hypothetical protein
VITHKNLRDRLYRAMKTSGRIWSSEEIARAALRIVSNPSRAESLVEAILGDDSRFHREEGGWRVSHTRTQRLEGTPFVLIDAPRPDRPALAVPLYFQAFDNDRAVGGEILEVRPMGTGLDRVLPWLVTRVGVSLNAATVRHNLHQLECLHPLPTTSDRLIDLAAILRLHGERVPGPFARDSSASMEERFHASRRILEFVLHHHGDWSLEDLEDRIETSLAGEPVDFSRFRFGRDRLREIPVQPGIYRFFGDRRAVLYVGKSRDLRRRISSYFRPLAPDHTRRAQLLAELRDVEWETTPSELEAMILESELIRHKPPRHNRQVDASGETVSRSDNDLAFVICEGDPDEVSVFFLRNGKAWARTRLPRDPDRIDWTELRSIVDAWIADRITPDLDLHAIADPEGLLVLRYLRLFGDAVDRLRMGDFPRPKGVGDVLFDLATRDRPSGDSWSLRSPAADTI